MKKRYVLTLVLAVMLAIFTGCEPEPSLPELTLPKRLAIVKEYHGEIFDLVVSNLEESTPTDFEESDPILLGEGITCFVTASDLDEINLFMSLDEWVAADGTEISGTIILDIEYHTSSEVSLNIVRTGIPATLYFDSSSVSYIAELTDGDSLDPTFIPESDYFAWVSVIVDGKLLVNNPIGYK